MILIPYSTALTLSRPPWLSYGLAALCIIVFSFQIGGSLTESLQYVPGSWNPLSMVASSFAHVGIGHLVGNLIFFFAFAPALEILIASPWRYLCLLVFLSIAVSIGYSISIMLGSSPPLPTIGLSGVVMGLIGLSAFLMPRARIRVFCWLIFFWKIIFVPSWAVALFFIGIDSWVMLTTPDYAGINIVAHVTGGFAGYLYGHLWLKDRRDDTSDELAEEIEAMRVEQRHGKTRGQAHRYKKAMEPIEQRKKIQRDDDRFMSKMYQMVKTHRDAEAINELLSRYDVNSRDTELEPVFDRMAEWGGSRALLCLGRLIIQRLDNERRHGRALFFIEKCQAFSPGFVLPDVAKTLFYAQMAIDTGKQQVARQLVDDPLKRYGNLVNHQQCNHLLQKTSAARSG